MDGDRFDRLTRTLVSSRTRRGFLRGLAGAIAVGALGARDVDAQVTQAQCGNVSCRTNPGKCKDGCVCCAYGNDNSRCRPPDRCPGAVTTTTTTTTTQAPTTTSTTTTTATTSPPNQGSCETGEDFCVSGASARCDSGGNTCLCLTTISGNTFCGGFGDCVNCDSDADCVPITGAGSVCTVGNPTTGSCCFRECHPPCGA